jgi:DNA anti-recombination protein RmuC
MTNDLEGRVDKLSEAVGVVGERVAQVEHEQRAMRGSIDQLTGEVRQLDQRLNDISGQFDRRLGDMSSQFDKRLEQMTSNFDKRLEQMTSSFDKRLEQMTSSFDKRIKDIKWVISFGMGLIILLMTLYRFLKLTSLPQ